MRLGLWWSLFGWIFWWRLWFWLRVVGGFGFLIHSDFFGGGCGYVEGYLWWRLWLWISGFALGGGGAWLMVVDFEFVVGGGGVGFRCSWV